MTHIRRYVAGALTATFFMALGSLLSRNPLGAASPPMPNFPLRSYYLTQSNYAGNGPLTACATGYHMASYTEMLNPSGMRYDTTLGRTATDSGGGAVSGTGWVRSGYSDAVLSPGTVYNCSGWSSANGAQTGVALTIQPVTTEFIQTWLAKCDNSEISSAFGIGVWCMQDY